jgi:hypothetical protein
VLPSIVASLKKDETFWKLRYSILRNRPEVFTPLVTLTVTKYLRASINTKRVMPSSYGSPHSIEWPEVNPVKRRCKSAADPFGMNAGGTFDSRTPLRYMSAWLLARRTRRRRAMRVRRASNQPFAALPAEPAEGGQCGFGGRGFANPPCPQAGVQCGFDGLVTMLGSVRSIHAKRVGRRRRRCPLRNSIPYIRTSSESSANVTGRRPVLPIPLLVTSPQVLRTGLRPAYAHRA